MEDMNLTQVTERLAALDIEVREATELEAVEKLGKEKKELLARKAELEELEQRKQTALNIASGIISPKIVETRKEMKMEDKAFDRSTEEYRVAWLKNLQGKELTETEKRTGLTATAAIPEATANRIVETMVDMVPILGEIELFRIPGNLNIAVQSVAPGATIEAGGGEVTESTATLKNVSLGGYNMNAFISVGADLSAMAIPAFEDWLVRKLSEGIAYEIENQIINGTGISSPKGIEKYATWTTANGCDFTGGSNALQVADLDKAVGLIPAAYDRESKWLMSKKTFFTHVSGLTDINNWPVVEKESGVFYLRGYQVVFSDKVEANAIYFGSFKRGMVGNLSSDVRVEKQRNLRYNSWDFLGWAVFDCEPAADGCIVKLKDGLTA
jgi:HK97 family phage major capsid protein